MAIAPVEIEIDELCKRFGGAQEPLVLDRIDLAIRHNEFVALLGRSGCGKSTLLNLVAGLLEPSAGEVRVKGRRVTGPAKAGHGVPAARSVPVAHRPGQCRVRLQELWPAGRRTARARPAAARPGRAQGLRGPLSPELSGGMQQRVAIARALALDPDSC